MLLYLKGESTKKIIHATLLMLPLKKYLLLLSHNDAAAVWFIFVNSFIFKKKVRTKIGKLGKYTCILSRRRIFEYLNIEQTVVWDIRPPSVSQTTTSCNISFRNI